ncbi:MAG: hypothetical protein WKF77_20325 [Planctomycetaceae bacterium]
MDKVDRPCLRRESVLQEQLPVAGGLFAESGISFQLAIAVQKA